MARELLQSDGQEYEYVLSPQVLQEFFVAATRKLDRPLDGAKSLEAVRSLSQLSVVQIDPDMDESASPLSMAHGVPSWDALFIQAAVTSDCAVLLSEDMQDGRRFDGLRIENTNRG